MSFPSAVSTASAVWKKCIRVSFFFLHFLILKTFAKTLWLAFPSFSLISSFARLSLRTNLFEPQKGKYAGSGSEFNPLALLRGLFLKPGKTRNFVFSLLGLWRVLLCGCNPLSFLFKGISRREDRGGRWGCGFQPDLDWLLFPTWRQNQSRNYSGEKKSIVYSNILKIRMIQW